MMYRAKNRKKSVKNGMKKSDEKSEIMMLYATILKCKAILDRRQSGLMK